MATLVAGNFLNATSGATICSVEELSGSGAKSGKSCNAGKLNCTRPAGIRPVLSADPMSRLVPAWPG
jgi:hypothetical protein